MIRKKKCAIRNDRRKSKQSKYMRIGRSSWCKPVGHGSGVVYHAPIDMRLKEAKLLMGDMGFKRNIGNKKRVIIPIKKSIVKTYLPELKEITNKIEFGW